MIIDDDKLFDLKSTEHLRLSSFVFEHTVEAIMITDKHNRIITVNKALERIMGYSKKLLIGRDPVVFSSSKQDAHYYRHIWKDLIQFGHWKGEVFNRRKNGETFPQELTLDTVKNEHGETTYYVGIFRDLTARKATEKKLAFYANNEPLTGLSNRHAFIDSIEHQIYIAKRHNAPFSVVFFNIDRFKEINDIHGHDVGDDLLRAVAKRIVKTVRNEDVVCRYGGDEFTVLLINTTLNKASIVTEKLQAQMRKPFALPTIRLDITGSIGIAQFPEGGMKAATLLRNANHAMVGVQERGRNGIAFHNDKHQADYLRKLTLRNELKKAIKQRKLKVFYQPIIDLNKQVVNKFESLVRWPIADGSYISPGEFIPIAEEFGLIHLIGDFVLQRACEDLKKLHSLGFSEVRFSINRSITEFHHVLNKAGSISQVIVANGLPFDAIVIEITESVAMSSNTQTEQILSELRNKGVRIALDDFCTGQSSLSNLIEYKSDYLKIDKAFIDLILTERNHQILISTLISLATKLDMQVIAEGVESKEQRDLLQRYGCHFIQGFYYSPARPLEQCIKLLKEPLKE
jgi:diguanylate cyclase (GGDEF)-like protein/PAS domain S-box-containing protein